MTENDQRIGTMLGAYQVTSRIADGAMGRVYEARHPETSERVAIKVLHPDVAKDTVAVERFKREFESAEELDHPGVVRVYEFGETADGSHFMTMEYLDGEELTKALEREQRFGPAMLLKVVCELAPSLDHAHSFGFIHRDLKPDNIFLHREASGDITVKVLDFGSVKLQMETGPKLTAFGTTLGSPYYMSPEQAMGQQDVDQRTDVFAVAAMVWEMATGQVCFSGSNVAEILMKIVQASPAAPSSVNGELPPSFDQAVLAGLAKEKQGRPASVGALADSLLQAYGLTEGHAVWEQRTLVELQQALASSKPASVHPDPLADMDAAMDAAMSGAHTDDPPTTTSLPGTSSTGLYIGIGLAVVGILALGAWFLFGAG